MGLRNKQFAFRANIVSQISTEVYIIAMQRIGNAQNLYECKSAIDQTANRTLGNSLELVLL